MNKNQVVLVNSSDDIIGTADKLAAHQFGGLRHRAFSVFIYREGKLLLQKRANSKYHAGSLWSNTCCSHPQPGKEIKSSAEMRLQDELGFTTELTQIGRVEYKTSVDNGLTEWEIDYLYTGVYHGSITPNPSEVEAFQWLTPEELELSLIETPSLFTPWLPLIWPTFKTFSHRNSQESRGQIIDCVD